MSTTRSLFANYEVLVLRVARVVLVVLATLTFITIIVALIWITVMWIKPTNTNYKHIMNVPSYASIESEWNSSFSAEDANAAIVKKIPPVLAETVETLDSLYQLVGRKEQRFSETIDVTALHTHLVAPFSAFDQPDQYAVDFLIELEKYAHAMVEDELLKRIADVNVRTQTIMDSLTEFRDDYVINLEGALATMETRSSTHWLNRMVSSLVVLQVLSVCITAFVVSTVCLLGFHLAMQRQGLLSTLATSSANDEDG